ncbi:hypothetical protein [Streptomyces sp. NPDC015131]|uniref:hypothetical protein n=1 Tax=Streptomyces sp. NPDC015131 TaxID=3364941 RepID=UPI00370096B0
MFTNPYLRTFPPERFSIDMVSDGTSTLVEIVDNAYGALVPSVIGVGRSKRRKKDARNDVLGQALAMQRAFLDAAERLQETIDKAGRI